PSLLSKFSTDGYGKIAESLGVAVSAASLWVGNIDGVGFDVRYDRQNVSLYLVGIGNQKPSSVQCLWSLPKTQACALA
ncbi:MAG: hypothetical protein AB7C95_08215, partial [Synergistaceae bacterium]